MIRRKKRPALLVPKSLGKRLEPKPEAPVRDAAHLQRVREYGCLICRRPAQAHHLKGLFPRTMGTRIGDDKTAPLCPEHHAELHSGSERAFWSENGVDPVLWAENFVRKCMQERKAA